MRCSNKVLCRSMASEGSKSGGLIDRWFGLESNQAREGEVSNRWMMAVPAVGISICITEILQLLQTDSVLVVGLFFLCFWIVHELK